MSNHKPSLNVAATVLIIFTSLTAPVALAQSMAMREIRVTSSPSTESQPVLGADSISPIVVFQSFDHTTLPAYGQIYYQRFDSNGLIGPPILVSTGGTDDQLSDISGDLIVYTAFVSPSSDLGQIKLFRISTGATSVISNMASVLEARISGNRIVWVEGDPGQTRVMLTDLFRLANGDPPIALAGPAPPVNDVEISDRLVVWTERNGEQLDVAGLDLLSGSRLSIAADPLGIERVASTSGPWVAWQASTRQARATAVAPVRIEAYNLDTGERRVIADNGSSNLSPTIDGDVIAYESNTTGQFDVYVHRLSANDTYRATVDPADQRLNNVFGNYVAYVDSRDGNPNVYITSFVFQPGIPGPGDQPPVPPPNGCPSPGERPPGGTAPPCSDTTAPLLNLPTNMVAEATGPAGAVVTYTATAEDAVDGPRNVICDPASGSTFGIGTTVVNCSASDTRGNTSTGSFFVTVRDTTAPETIISSALDGNRILITPGVLTVSTDATFIFTGADAVGVANFECSLDGVGFSACSSPRSYTGLTIGIHTVRLRAKDAAGNVDPTPAAFSWNIVTPAQAIQGLLNFIASLGLPTSLSAPLKEASDLLMDGNPNNDRAACDQLTAFLNELDAKERSRQITSAHALQLRQQAQAIQAALGC